MERRVEGGNVCTRRGREMRQKVETEETRRKEEVKVRKEGRGKRGERRGERGRRRENRVSHNGSNTCRLLVHVHVHAY